MITHLLKNPFLSSRTPIWFMRQAGRYLPEYKVIRKTKDSFLDLCFDSNLAAEISLQPIKRFDLDAIIVFSDILVIPYALNQTVSFVDGIGPKLKPILSINDLVLPSKKEFLNKLNPTFVTLQILKRRKKQLMNLIGFCGSPLTVLTYMLEGQTSKDHSKIKCQIAKNPKTIERLIEALIKYSIIYLDSQIIAGAEVIQLFESWASIVTGRDYDKFVIEPNKIIVNAIKKLHPHVPIICFPRNNPMKLEDFVKNVNCDILSTDLNLPEKVEQECLKRKIVIQGNLDPIKLLVGGSGLQKEVKRVLKRFSKNKHIFNLSHGILPQTPILHVEQTIKIIRKYDETRLAS